MRDARDIILDESLNDTRWRWARATRVDGGMNTLVDADSIDESEASHLENVRFWKGGLLIDTGYTKVGGDIDYGAPKKLWTHIDNAGVAQLLLITDETVYLLSANDVWEVVSNGTDTTLSVTATAGADNITLTDDTGFGVGSIVGIVLDAGGVHSAKLTVDNGGGNYDIDTVGGMPSQATSGNAVHEAPALNGIDTEQVVTVAAPANEWSIITNGVDAPVRWDGSTCEEIPGLGTPDIRSARTAAVFKDHLVLGGVNIGGTSYPNRVWWSDTADYTNWDDTDPNSNAGFEDLIETRDPVTALYALANDMIVYRERSIVRMEFVGSSTILFQFRQMLHGMSAGAGLGAVSPNAVYAERDQHMFLARSGVYIYRGGFSAQEISQKVSFGYFDATGLVDQENLRTAFLHYAEERDEVFCFFPTGVEDWPTRALVFNRRFGRWRLRQFRYVGGIAGSGARIGRPGIRIIDLVGTIEQQTWVIGSAALGSDYSTIVLADPVSNEVLDYDFVTSQEDGQEVTYNIRTPLFMSGERQWRIDQVQLHVGGSPNVWAGPSYLHFDIGVFFWGQVPSSQYAFHRLWPPRSIDKTGTHFVMTLSGAGGAFRFSSWAAKFREDSRLGLPGQFMVGRRT